MLAKAISKKKNKKLQLEWQTAESKKPIKVGEKRSVKQHRSGVARTAFSPHYSHFTASAGLPVSATLPLLPCCVRACACQLSLVSRWTHGELGAHEPYCDGRDSLPLSPELTAPMAWSHSADKKVATVAPVSQRVGTSNLLNPNLSLHMRK